MLQFDFVFLYSDINIYTFDSVLLRDFSETVQYKLSDLSVHSTIFNLNHRVGLHAEVMLVC
jgi:hypothetical protein